MSEHRLSEIVIERPRSGGGISLKKLQGFKKQMHRITQEATEDGLFNSYLIKPRHKTKHLSDHLGPLRRLLRSKVGQPWNDVHSELCQRLDSNTMVGRHVLDHVKDYVKQHVRSIDGVLYAPSSWGRLTPLGSGYWDQFYVDPETGILCAVPKVRRKREPDAPPNDLLIQDDYHRYLKLNDLWFLVTFEDFPPPPTESVTDVLVGSVRYCAATYWRGRRLYAVHKRQCNKKEIRFILSRLAKH
jgi:hypothetical protein